LVEEKKKILILTYYWPPSGGSGVQRWMYFAYYLDKLGFEPVILTVDPKSASYKFTDRSFLEKVNHLRTIRTSTREPFGFYSKLIGSSREEAIPLGFSGESHPGIIKKVSRFIRGNFFIPDARVGWVSPALKEARKLLRKEKFECVISTGPPHSAHLIGLKLKKEFPIKWIADFRDPWTELYYNKLLYRTAMAEKLDRSLETKVLAKSDLVLTIGPSMLELLQAKIPGEPGKVHYVYNGFDAESFSEIKKESGGKEFVICHLGILSDNQPITGFLSALKLFHQRNKDAFSKIVLKLIGKVSPAVIAEIQMEAPFLRTENIPYVPHRQALQHIANADLLFNSLAATEQGKYLISGKLMEYLASGNPILCLGDPQGDAARLLSGFPDSSVFDRKDTEKMSVFVENIFMTHGNKQHLPAAERVMKYSRQSTAAELSRIIWKLISPAN
jgi:glycosyltransferase involved in cell wall biosynthesis